MALAASVPDYSGKVQRWNITESSPQINYFIDPSAASIASLIISAEDEWSAVPTSYAKLVETVDETQAQIIFKVMSQLTDANAAGDAAWSQSSSGALLCTATILDSVAAQGAGAKVTVLHEAGHCLGLTHSVASGAVMSYRPGSDLSSDDFYAVTLLYPKGSANSYPMGCASVHGSPPGLDGTASFAMVVLFFFAGLGLARRRFRIHAECRRA